MDHRLLIMSKAIYFALITISMLTGCGEDLEEENAELRTALTEIEVEIHRLNSIIAANQEIAAENTQLEKEAARLQTQIDKLNAIIAANQEIAAENTQLKKEVAQLQAQIDKLIISADVVYQEIKHQKDSSAMVLVPAGDFIMGTSDSQLDEITRWKRNLREIFRHEQPQHIVYLDSFYIDKYEVTNAQFEKFVTDTGYITDAEQEGWGYVWEGYNEWPRIRGANWRSPLGPGSTIQSKMNHPVIQVSYNDAVAYAEWAGKRLPTEAEWEKAARGTDGRLFSWGNVWDPKKLNSWEAGPHTTTSVGSYPDGASPYGAHDMLGNVWEWVADWYYAAYYAKSLNQPNPRGPTQGVHRVLRGACWQNTRDVARCAHRDNYVSVPDFRVHLGGFRCAKSLTP